jgi:ubiquitin C-terminal hydrolase
MGNRESNQKAQPGIVGLKNFENTCYLNSGIQCLSHTPLLTEFLLQNADAFPSSTLAGEYIKLLQQIWAGKSRTIVPKELKKTIDATDRFKGVSDQHDAFEFLLFLIERLHKAEVSIGDMKGELILEQKTDPTARVTKSHSDSLIPDEQLKDPPKLTRTSSGTNLKAVGKKVKQLTTTDLDRGETSPRTRKHSTSSNSSTNTEKSLSLGRQRDNKETKRQTQKSYLLIGGGSTSTHRSSDDVRAQLAKLGEYADTCWRQHVKRKGSSIWTRHFHGQTKQSFTCQACNKTAVTFCAFPYMDVPLSSIDPLNPEHQIRPTSLRECLRTKERGEIVRDWLCPLCGERGEAVRQTQVWKHPNVLVFRLGRVCRKNNKEVKITTALKFPIMGLRMPYCVNDGPDRMSVEVFDLYAVLSHVGKADEGEGDVTAEEGHFIVHAQNQLDGNWYTFNDASVVPLHLTSNKFQSKEAYILFYRKRGSWPVGPATPTVPPPFRPSTPPPSPPGTPTSSFPSACSRARPDKSPPRTVPQPPPPSLSLDDHDLRKCRSC